MAVKLRGDEGYYAKTVEIDGSKFWIADLSDEEYEEFLEKANAAATERGLGGKKLVEALQNPAVLLELQAETAGDVEKQKRLRKADRDLLHWLLSRGLVKWDLPADEVDGTLLPAQVKAQLAQAIIKASSLEQDEATFPAGVGAGGGGRG